MYYAVRNIYLSLLNKYPHYTLTERHYSVGRYVAELNEIALRQHINSLADQNQLPAQAKILPRITLYTWP